MSWHFLRCSYSRVQSTAYLRFQRLDDGVIIIDRKPK